MDGWGKNGDDDVKSRMNERMNAGCMRMSVQVIDVQTSEMCERNGMLIVQMHQVGLMISTER